VGKLVVGDAELEFAVCVGANGVPNNRSLYNIAGFDAVLGAVQLSENRVMGRGAPWAVPGCDRKVGRFILPSGAPHNFITGGILG
jgi:hypothetical protein